jgi:hypothetical protein
MTIRIAVTFVFTLLISTALKAQPLEIISKCLVFFKLSEEEFNRKSALNRAYYELESDFSFSRVEVADSLDQLGLCQKTVSHDSIIFKGEWGSDLFVKDTS